ncbi:hypothetical protein [Dethiothermospora halolimnae]|uniref:hypothetical protein n=1 Tax=Dethiothermospora halolimnae TaxID=3114390 RepID=UPI003CCBE792
MDILKGRIVEIEKNVNKITYVTQQIKKNEQPKYDDRYPGGCGTYVTGSEYLGTTLEVKIFIYDLKRCIYFDIYEYVLLENKKCRISSKLLDHVVTSNVGKKVNVGIDDNNNYFDMSQLDVIPQ